MPALTLLTFPDKKIINEVTLGFIHFINETINCINTSVQVDKSKNDDDASFVRKISQIANAIQLIEVSKSLIEKNLLKSVCFDDDIRSALKEKLNQIHLLRELVLQEMKQDLDAVLRHKPFDINNDFSDLSVQQIYFSSIYHCVNDIEKSLLLKNHNTIVIENRLLHTWHHKINNVVSNIEYSAQFPTEFKKNIDFTSKNHDWRDRLIKFYTLLHQHNIAENSYNPLNQIKFKKEKIRPYDNSPSGLSMIFGKQKKLPSSRITSHPQNTKQLPQNTQTTTSQSSGNTHQARSEHSRPSETIAISTINNKQSLTSTKGVASPSSPAANSQLIPFNLLPNHKKAALDHIQQQIEKLSSELENSNCLCLFEKRKSKKQDGLYYLKKLIITSGNKSLSDLVVEVRNEPEWKQYLNAGFFSGGLFSFKSRTQKLLDTLATVNEDNYKNILGNYSLDVVVRAYCSGTI